MIVQGDNLPLVTFTGDSVELLSIAVGGDHNCAVLRSTTTNGSGSAECCTGWSTDGTCGGCSSAGWSGSTWCLASSSNCQGGCGGLWCESSSTVEATVVQCWGDNSNGALGWGSGDGSTHVSPDTGSAVDLGTDVEPFEVTIPDAVLESSPVDLVGVRIDCSARTPLHSTICGQR